MTCVFLYAIFAKNINMKNIGTFIRDTRKKKGITQVNLAKHSKITQGYLSQIESGKRKNIMPTVLERIGNSLDVPLPVFQFMSLEIKDIPKNKRESFSALKPAIDALINEFFKS